MVCYHPRQAFYSVSPITGERSLLRFDMGVNLNSKDCISLQVPCGQCIGCRLSKSRDWAQRIMHEAQMHEFNCFLTLTYSDEFLPPDGSLRKSDFQKFMKRLRKFVSSGEDSSLFNTRGSIRYYHCGEYGENFSRPHYHCCLFGLEFTDLELLRRQDAGDLFTSECLSHLWGLGFCTIGDLSFESAAYVARYVTKKITGDAASDHYGSRVPEYSTMSRRPGIGCTWYNKYKGDCFPSDYLIIEGSRVPVPRYYDSLLDKEDPKLLVSIKDARVASASERAFDNTPARLKVREFCQVDKFNRLTRKLESNYDS